MKYWNESSLENSLYQRAIAGREGAIRILRPSADDSLTVQSGMKFMPLVKLSLSIVSSSGQRFTNEETFAGELYVDRQGDNDCSARMVWLSEEGTTVLSTAEKPFDGHLFVVASQEQGKKALPFVYSAIFNLNAEHFRSAAVWGQTPEWLYYAALEQTLLARGLNG